MLEWGATEKIKKSQNRFVEMERLKLFFEGTDISETRLVHNRFKIAICSANFGKIQPWWLGGRAVV